jgi:sulfopyruvate decarboxylase TPP-binding subunit
VLGSAFVGMRELDLRRSEQSPQCAGAFMGSRKPARLSQSRGQRIQVNAAIVKEEVEVVALPVVKMYSHGGSTAQVKLPWKHRHKGSPRTGRIRWKDLQQLG